MLRIQFLYFRILRFKHNYQGTSTQIRSSSLYKLRDHQEFQAGVASRITRWCLNRRWCLVAAMGMVAAVMVQQGSVGARDWRTGLHCVARSGAGCAARAAHGGVSKTPPCTQWPSHRTACPAVGGEAAARHCPAHRCTRPGHRLWGSWSGGGGTWTPRQPGRWPRSTATRCRPKSTRCSSLSPTSWWPTSASSRRPRCCSPALPVLRPHAHRRLPSLHTCGSPLPRPFFWASLVPIAL